MYDDLERKCMIIPQGLKCFGLAGKPLRLTRNIKRARALYRELLLSTSKEREVEVKEGGVPQDLVLKLRDR